MNIPRIPGYPGSAGHSLGSLWQKPHAEFPEELWPARRLGAIDEYPTEWITVVEHHFGDDGHGGVSCVLIDPAAKSEVLQYDTWSGDDLGSAGIVTTFGGRGQASDAFFDGLASEDRGTAVEFFSHVRTHHDLVLPSVEVSPSFLWYWDAHPSGQGWAYLDDAGRDQGLIRVEVKEDYWRVEVRALELRQFLSVCNRALVVQHDLVITSPVDGFRRVDDEFRTDWCYFTWLATADRPLPAERPSFSRLLGKYVIAPMANGRQPRHSGGHKGEYPDFQYGINRKDGAALMHTSDPSRLGTYYDPPEAAPRLHYLTPIYFRREVLQRYTSEPSRYSVSANRIRCLDLWGVQMSVNTAGLVEVYLGDLGRDLPAGEWAHWVGHNVPPSGDMTEDRVMRDFLNVPSPSRDPIGDLRRAREETRLISQGLFGDPLWKALEGRQRQEFDNLYSPVTSDPSALDTPVLTLAKGLIDALDSAALKAFLGAGVPKDPGSLNLLRAVIERLGGDPRAMKPIRDLQSIRSGGGPAHLAGRDANKVLMKAGIDGLTPVDAFDKLCTELAQALQYLGSLFARPTAST